MKEVFILTSIVFVGVFSAMLGNNVFAKSAFGLPDPGLTPESPIYFLDIWDENARLFFSRSDTSRLRRYRARVLERLSEAEALAGRGISATQRALELYRADMPLFYAVAERLGDALTLTDALRMASDNLNVLDHISERTDFEKKRFVTVTKIFLIDQQLQSLHILTKQKPAEALQIFGDALQRRMARIREVAIDDQNNQEALKEYAAYMSETEKIIREWDSAEVNGLPPALFLKQTVVGHEETLLGPVRDRLPVTLEEELLLVVNGVRKLTNKEPLLALPIKQVPPQNTLIEFSPSSTASTNATSTLNGATTSSNNIISEQEKFLQEAASAFLNAKTVNDVLPFIDPKLAPSLEDLIVDGIPLSEIGEILKKARLESKTRNSAEFLTEFIETPQKERYRSSISIWRFPNGWKIVSF